MITAAKALAKAPRPGGVIETPISPARGACAPRCRLVGGVWSWGIGETNLWTNGLESTRVGGVDVVSVKPPTSTARARDPRTRRETVSTLRPRVCGCRATSVMAARVAPLCAQTRNAERITTGSLARTSRLGLSRAFEHHRARARLSRAHAGSGIVRSARPTRQGPASSTSMRIRSSRA